ncbi:MAG: response regulator [Chloroflexota bacterium]
MNKPEENGQGHSALIMMVDDNPEFLSGIETVLEMEGYKVWTASQGQEALDQLKSVFLGEKLEDPTIDRLPDLILADIMMPVMDGYDFYEQARSNPYLNNIPFVFFTAKSSDVDVRRGKELGSDDYLSKLCSPEDLLASVRGKLSRMEQQRSLAAQFTGDPSKPAAGGVMMLLAIVIVVAAIAFCAGSLIFPGMFG